MPKVGRNDPCPCGSGKKYKKCCMSKDEARKLETSNRDTDTISDEIKNSSQLRGRAAEIQNIFQRGCNQLERGEYDHAAKAFTSVLRLDPKHYEALTGLGRCFMEMGIPEEARKCFEKALEIKPDYTQAVLNLNLIR